MADNQITAGLVALTVADRMAAVALSRGDRDRSAEIAQSGEKALRTGFATLSAFVEKERKEYKRVPTGTKRSFLSQHGRNRLAWRVVRF